MKNLLFFLLMGASLNLYSQWTRSSCFAWGADPQIVSSPGSVSVMNGFWSVDNVISVFNGEEEYWSAHLLNNFEQHFSGFYHEDSRIILYNYFMSSSTMVAVSPDFGTNWNYYDLGCVTDVCIINGSIIAADTYGYINISNDEGVSWSWIPVPNFNLSPYDPMLLANDGNVLYITCPSYQGYDLYKCMVDNGALTGMQFIRYLGLSNSIRDILVHNGNLYIAASDGLMFSEDQGETFTMISSEGWYKIVADSAYFYVRNTGIRKYSFLDHTYSQILPEGSNIFEIGACNGGVFALLSYDAGSTYDIYQYTQGIWKGIDALYISEASSFQNVRVIDNLVFSNNQKYSEGTLVNSRVCVSHDMGRSYTTLTGSSVTTFCDAIKYGDKYLIAGGGGVAVADTTNNTLSQTSGITADTATSLLIFNSTLYAGTTNGLYSSADNGLHWTFIGLSGKRINKIAVFDNKLFAATPFGLFMSEDGTSWGTTSCPFISLTDIEGMNDRLFVSSFAGLVMYYQNTWTPVGAGLLGTGVNALVSRNNVLYAGTSQGSVMYSQDNGQTWADISNPEFHSVTGLDIYGGHIFTSEAQGGIWSRWIGYPQQINDLSSSCISIYPIPAQEFISIQMPQDQKGPAIVEVLNLQGISLMKIKVDGIGDPINIRSLPKGMYLIRVFSAGKSYTSRFIRQ